MSYEPVSLYSEILENLFMGGTDDEDVIHIATPYGAAVTLPFEAIVTMYAWARPADWRIQEFRYGIPDSSIQDIDLARLKEAVEFGYARWKVGDRVLIRCQAGLNRSGLVTALILMKSGLSAEGAIQEIRERRAELALFNRHYVQWLTAEGCEFLNPSEGALKEVC